MFKAMYNDVMRMADSLSGSFRDPDGAPMSGENLIDAVVGMSTGGDNSYEALYEACWKSYKSSPFVQTAVNDFCDSVTGDGFEITSSIPRIRKLLESHYSDFRNKLYCRYRQFLLHYRVTGENYTCLTLSNDAPFVEVDYIDPITVKKIYFHPDKTHMPLWYKIKKNDEIFYVPSINLAYAPSLIDDKKIKTLINEIKIDNKFRFYGNKNDPKFRSLRGNTMFIVDWEGEYITERPISKLRTIIAWNNLYTMLKLIEVDHKRSNAAYVWRVRPENQEAFDFLVGLDKETLKKIGLIGQKTPGSTVFEVPGCHLDAVGPALQPISGQDSDILEMVVSGLNTPSDIVTGSSDGTFASVKSTRAPLVERIRHFQNWHMILTKYEFWKPVLFLHSAAYSFPKQFKTSRVVGFKNKKNVEALVPSDPWELLDFSYPQNENQERAGLVSEALGSKNDGTVGFGISHSTSARRFGVGNYHNERLKLATENMKYPDTGPSPNKDELNVELGKGNDVGEKNETANE